MDQNPDPQRIPQWTAKNHQSVLPKRKSEVCGHGNLWKLCNVDPGTKSWSTSGIHGCHFGAKVFCVKRHSETHSDIVAHARAISPPFSALYPMTSEIIITNPAFSLQRYARDKQSLNPNYSKYGRLCSTTRNNDHRPSNVIAHNNGCNRYFGAFCPPREFKSSPQKLIRNRAISRSRSNNLASLEDGKRSDDLCSCCIIRHGRLRWFGVWTLSNVTFYAIGIR